MVRNFVWKCYERAKKIITVSEFSKSEIVKYFKVDPDNITVIPNAWQHYEESDMMKVHLVHMVLEKNNYYFSMCSLEPNKNFKWIAEEARKNADMTFAVAGYINRNVFSEGLGFELPPNMKLLGFVSDEEAKTLMRDCSAFLFPTSMRDWYPSAGSYQCGSKASGGFGYGCYA